TFVQDVPRKGIELGLVALRRERAVHGLEQRPEIEQPHIWFGGLRRLRQLRQTVHAVPPQAASKNTVTLCRGCESEVVHTSRRTLIDSMSNFWTKVYAT